MHISQLSKLCPFLLQLINLPHSNSLDVLQESLQATLSSYGSFCNETIPCNHSALLICYDSSCHCILQESMTFQYPQNQDDGHGHGHGQCVSLVDEACGQMSMDTSEVRLQCVQNSFCNSQGECQCHSGFYKSDQGLCLNQKRFGEECSVSLECSELLGLACVNETCGCDPNLGIDSLKFFDHEEGDGDQHRCLGRPGQPCLNGHCVPNAICKEIEIVDPDLPVSTNQSKPICTCQSGFEDSKSKSVCVGTFNKTCDTQSNRLCRRDFSCVKGFCGCKYPAHQIYDKEYKTCISNVGGPCNPEGCVPNAICKRMDTSEDGEAYYTSCECDEGFVENHNRTCDVAFGYPCSQMLEDWKCDTVGGLVCRDGFCSCPDPSQIFDKTSMKCRGLVGSFCDMRIKDKSQCVANSRCAPHRNGILFVGHCQCEGAYVTAENRTCV